MVLECSQGFGIAPRALELLPGFMSKMYPAFYEKSFKKGFDKMDFVTPFLLSVLIFSGKK